MGEMADFVNDQGDFAFEFSDSDYEQADNDRYEPPHIKGTYECDYCGRKGLVWWITACGWRLHTHDGTTHVCYQGAK